VRYKQYKFLFTPKETWLGPQILLLAPAVYNLQWDLGEQYDILSNGAAPTRGDFKSSPGRFACRRDRPRPRTMAFLPAKRTLDAGTIGCRGTRLGLGGRAPPRAFPGC
jgi:hypothetical protein